MAALSGSSLNAGGTGSGGSSSSSSGIFSRKLGYLPHRIAAGPLINGNRLLAVSSFSDSAVSTNQVQVLSFDGRSFSDVLTFPSCFPMNSLCWASRGSSSSSGGGALENKTQRSGKTGATSPETYSPAMSGIDLDQEQDGGSYAYNDSAINNAAYVQKMNAQRYLSPGACTEDQEPDAKTFLLTACSTVRVYDISAGQAQMENVREFRHNNVASGGSAPNTNGLTSYCAPVTGVAAADQGAFAVSCDVYGYVYIWDIERGVSVSQPIDINMPLFDVCFRPGSASEIAVAGSGQIGLYDLREPQKGLCMVDAPVDARASGPGRLSWARNDFLAAAWMGEGTQFGLCVYDPRECLATNFQLPTTSKAAGEGPVDVAWSGTAMVAALESKGQCVSARVREDLSIEGSSGITWDLGWPVTALATTTIPSMGHIAVLGATNENLYVGQLGNQ